MKSFNPLFLNKRAEEEKNKIENERLKRLTLIADQVVEILIENEILCSEIDMIFKIAGQKVNFEISKIKINEILKK